MEVYKGLDVFFIQDSGIGCTPNLQYTNRRNGEKPSLFPEIQVGNDTSL